MGFNPLKNRVQVNVQEAVLNPKIKIFPLLTYDFQKTECGGFYSNPGPNTLRTASGGILKI